jgi:WD40 repeat protein
VINMRKKDTRHTVNHLEKRENPYKALDFYKETDQKVFFGREEDAEKLIQLVKFYSLTVVFGKSGIGKTSLLNAGLFPRLRQEGFRPIMIRLNFAEEASPLKEQIRSAFEKGLAPSEVDQNKIEIKSQIDGIPPTPLSADETLWEYFHRVVHFTLADGKEKEVTPVLVFDQFEEIFTTEKHHKERDRIIDELYWLLEDQFPYEIRQRVLNNDIIAKRIAYSKRPAHFKVILSLRKDFLPNLNDLKTRIPSIDNVLFRVIHLNGRQARKVIEVGFDEKSVPNILRCFYPEESRDDQSMTVPDEKLEVEPVFLSLLCHQLFLEQPLEFLEKQEQEKILEDFYDTVMEEFPTKVKIFIEDNLLTKVGYRTPFYLAPDDPLDKSIDRLVEGRILRRFKHGNRMYVELIHDVVAHIAKEQRERRLREIREQEEEKKFKKGLRRWFIAAISVIAFIALLLALYAFHQKGIADVQYRRSQIDRLTAQAFEEFPKDNSKAIRSVEEALKISKGKSTEGLLRILSKMGYSSINRPFYTAITKLDSGDAIYSAVFFPDNQRILTAHENGHAYIRDLEGNILLELKGHTGRIMSAVVSPGGNQILTASWDNTARLWNLAGKQTLELKHDGPVTCASFSPDEKQILTASLDHTARLWNLQGRQLQEFKHEGRVIFASFSPDGSRILTASWDKTAKLWDQEGRQLVNLKRHSNILSSAVFSPDGRNILTGSRDETALLYNDQGDVLATFKHDSAIVSTLFSPDGKLILTADLDGMLKLWDRESLELKTSIKQEGVLSTVVFVPDGDRILTASENGAINLWNLQGNRVAHFDKHNQKIYAAAFSPNGHYLFTSSESEFSILWDLQPNIVLDLKHYNQVSKAIFSPDVKSNLILTRAEDGIARLWDNNGQFLTRFRHGRIIEALFAAKMDCIITASNDGAIKQWDFKGKCTNTLETNIRPLSRVFFSKDGSKILPLSNSKIVTLFNLQGEVIRTFQHDDIISEAVFSHNGEYLITVSSGDSKNPNYKGDTVTLWDLNTGNNNQPILSFKQENIASVVFSPGNSLILTASETGETIVRNLSGKIQHRFNLAIKNKELISAAVSPDDNRILTILSDGLVTLSNLKGVPLAEFKHCQDVYTAVFSPDGKHILTASLDKSAKLWGLDKNLLATFPHDGAVFSAAFSPDGNQVLTASRDATTKIWLTPSAILQWLEKSRIPQLTKGDKEELKISTY